MTIAAEHKPAYAAFKAAVNTDIGNWAADIIGSYPHSFGAALSRRYVELAKDKHVLANGFIRETHEALSGGLRPFGLSVNATDEEVRSAASNAASKVIQFKFDHWAAVSYCRSKGIEPPDCEPEPAMARMRCRRWWLRQLRKKHGRTAEAAAINLNLVCKKRAKYCSDNALMMHRSQTMRNQQILKLLEALNEDTGETMSLAELSKVNVSNLLNRRAELMVRMGGFEGYANGKGHVGCFYTITAPSKYHATLSKSGERNPKYQGATPRDTQSYLSKLWSRIRAKLARENLEVYGFRVCEPHHDATPHWHLLLFMQKAERSKVTRIMADYAMREDVQELHTDKRRAARFTAKNIDPSKGSATGYIAKYIAKNVGHVEGTGMTDDLYGGDINDYCVRVKAWASRWGIRQFQQIGGASVTVWRELRRIKSVDTESEQFKDIHKAADAGEWMFYLKEMGGAVLPRNQRPVWLHKTDKAALSAYGEQVQRVTGVEGFGQVLVSRPYKWRIEMNVKGGLSASCQISDPWSSVNNCTRNAWADFLLGDISVTGYESYYQPPPIEPVGGVFYEYEQHMRGLHG